jgi:hypothetical protein
VVTKDVSGNLVYTPNAGFTGPDSFTYIVNGGDEAAVAVTVEGGEPEPTLPTLTIGDVTVNEGDTATFTVVLSAVAASAVTVGYAVAPGTAQTESVQPATGILTFEPGQTTAIITVPIAEDTVAETAAQQFNVTLSNPQGATIADGQGIGTITDDDTPTEPTEFNLTAPTNLDENGTVSWDAVPGAARYSIWAYEADEGRRETAEVIGFVLGDKVSYALNGNDEAVGGSIFVTAEDAGGNRIAETLNQTAAIINVNDIPTGRPVISDNTPEVGQLLTISIGDLVDNDGIRADRPDEFGYIWQRSLDGQNWNLVGSGDAYTVTQGDDGYLIRGAAQYVDRGGLLETVYSLQTAKVGDANPNTPPVAFDDTTSTSSGEAVTIDVLANDFDFESDPMTFASHGQGANGTVTVQDGKLVYTPSANFVGMDTFEYTLNGGDTAKVTVTVAQPDAVLLTIATVDGLDENSTLSWNAIPGAAGYALYGYEPDEPDAPPHLLDFVTTTSFNIAGNDEFTGMVIYVMATDANGQEFLRSENETGLIENINDVPTGNLSIDDMTPVIGQTLTLGYGTFEDGDGYRDRGRPEEFEWSWQRSLDGVNWISVTTGQTYTVTQADNGYLLRGRAIYEDRAGDTIETVYSLSTIRVTATDTGDGDGSGDDGGDGGGETTPGSVIITQTDGSTAATELGANGTFALVLADAPTGNVTITVSGDNQVYALGPNGSSDVTFTPEDWNIPQTVTVIAAEDGMEEGPHTGNLFFQTTSTDQRYDGLMLDEMLPVDITDSAPEPDPMPYVTVANLGGDVTEGEEITFTFHRSEGTRELPILWERTGGTIDENDILAIKWNGVEGGFEGFRGFAQTATMTIVLRDDTAVEGMEGVGTVRVLPSQLYIYDDPVEASGNVLDNDVEPDNTGPVAVDDEDVTTPEDTPVTIPVLSNDLNANGDQLTVTASLAEGGTVAGMVTVVNNQVVFTPALNGNGDAAINYTISDGTFEDSAMVAVTVTPVNDRPILVSPLPDRNSENPFLGGPLQEGAAFQISINNNTSGNAFFTDVEDGQVLAFSATLESGDPLPQWMTFVPNGGQSGDMPTFLGTPPADAQGRYNVALTATDSGGLSVTDAFEVQVLDAPVIRTPVDQTFTRGAIGTVTPAGGVANRNAANARDANDAGANAQHGIIEFNLTAFGIENLTDAGLYIDPNGPNPAVGGTNMINVFAYIGNGTIEGGDAAAGSEVQVASAIPVTVEDIQTARYMRIDLDHELLQTVLSDPDTGGWIGFRIEVVNEAGSNPVFIEAGNGYTSASPSQLAWIMREG